MLDLETRMNSMMMADTPVWLAGRAGLGRDGGRGERERKVENVGFYQ